MLVKLSGPGTFLVSMTLMTFHTSSSEKQKSEEVRSTIDIPSKLKSKPCIMSSKLPRMTS
jgi:hypothetical protein